MRLALLLVLLCVVGALAHFGRSAHCNGKKEGDRVGSGTCKMVEKKRRKVTYVKYKKLRLECDKGKYGQNCDVERRRRYRG